MNTNIGNIFRITKEKDMDKILDKYKQNFVIAMFVTSTCDISKQFKTKFIETSKLYPMHYFVHINMNEFENVSYKYTENIKETPMIILFKNNEPFTYYKGSCKDSLINFIKETEELEEKIEFKEHSQKVYMLGKLDCIKELGIELTREYNMDNTLTDMKKEFNDIKENYLKMDNISSNKSLGNKQESIGEEIQPTILPEISDKDQKKLSKIKEAEAILKLKQNIEMQQLVKLQQLKKIHKFKKEVDDRNNKLKR